MCKEGADSLICWRMWGDAGRDYVLAESSTGERRELDKSTPDCWLFFCTILGLCALCDHQQAIHWPSQYPSLNTSWFCLPLLPPYFSQFPHFKFQFVSVNLQSCTYCKPLQKQTTRVHREQRKVCSLAEILMSYLVTGLLQWQGFL